MDKIKSPVASLVARTDHLIDRHKHGQPLARRDPLYFYKRVEWSADGTTLIAANSLREITSHVLPPDLLTPPSSHSPHRLSPPTATICLPEPILAYASSPYYALENPQTHLVLAACRDQPIQLHGLVPGSAADGETRHSSNISASTSSSSSSTCPASSSSSPDESASSGSDELEASLSQAHSSPCSSSSVIATFPLIHGPTEAHLLPTALAWPPMSPVPSFFLVGTRNTVAQFDITRPGPPVSIVPTIPSARHKLKGGWVGFKGVVSALGCQLQGGSWTGLVAAGTRTRHVGIYDLLRTRSDAAAVTVFGVAGATDAVDDAVAGAHGKRRRAVRGCGGGGDSGGPIGGCGITQTVWSPGGNEDGGRYLVVGERRATALLVYDIRVAGKLLGWLTRHSHKSGGYEEEGKLGEVSQQVLTGDVFAAQSGTVGAQANGHAEGISGEGAAPGGGFEVWVGDYNGCVQVWEHVGMHEGVQYPSWQWRAHDSGVPVGATALHQTGSVVATCSGSWYTADESQHKPENGHDDHDSVPRLRSADDCCIKVWNVEFGDSGA